MYEKQHPGLLMRVIKLKICSKFTFYPNRKLEWFFTYLDKFSQLQ